MQQDAGRRSDGGLRSFLADGQPDDGRNPRDDQHHRVRRGDTLSKIAAKYGTSISALGMAGLAPLEDGERGVITLTASVAAEDAQIGQDNKLERLGNKVLALKHILYPSDKKGKEKEKSQPEEVIADGKEDDILDDDMLERENTKPKTLQEFHSY